MPGLALAAPHHPSPVGPAQPLAAARPASEPPPETSSLTSGLKPSAAAALRRHLSHLRLAGTILDPAHRPRPRLGETPMLDGVPLRVDILDRFPPLERCILCAGPKGETYTICAGCYTTQARFAERTLLGLLPGLGEDALGGIQPLTHHQFVRAVRRTPRLEPRRRAVPEPTTETARRAALHAGARARRAAHLDALRAAASDPDVPPAERARRARRLRAAEAAPPWSAGAWERGRAEASLDDVWLALLARAPEAEDAKGDDEGYPGEAGEDDWMGAPDRVARLEEVAAPLVARASTAAGGPEHRAALERNALLDALEEARAAGGEGASRARWLARELEARGGVPQRGRARTLEWDDEACERWDRWVDALLGGDPARDPGSLTPAEAERCRRWAREAAATGAGEPVRLPRLDAGLPSGRLRWPHFVREEIEARFQPWGRWVEIPEEAAGTFRVWTDDDARPRRRRLRGGVLAGLPRRQRTEPRSGRPGTLPRPGGTRGAWEREIRAERRRRRFEQAAHAGAGIHPTHLEQARFQGP